MTQTTNILLISMITLMSVAFFTLLERKYLAYIQLRKGPNKVSIMGIPQPIADAMKLLTKTPNILENSNNTTLFMVPPLMLLTAMLPMTILPFNNSSPLDNQLSMLTYMIISSCMVYTMLIISWASNSKYSYLGCIRSVAQMISYEVSLFILILSILLMTHTTSLTSMHMYNTHLWLSTGLTLTLTLWIITCLAETNRTPFDFAESESELVSGYNVEYSGNMFTLIFLAEYTSMIIMSYLTSLMFSNSHSYAHMIPTISIMLLMLWTRGILPRLRYDILMKLNWKMILPLAITISTTTMTSTSLH